MLKAAKAVSVAVVGCGGTEPGDYGEMTRKPFVSALAAGAKFPVGDDAPLPNEKPRSIGSRSGRWSGANKG